MERLCHTEYTAKKKKQIEDSLMKLMVTQQYQDIRVTDICREADTPRRTFYHYFESKASVLDAVIESMMQQCFMNVLFDFRLGQEHMKNRFLQVFKFWEGENRRKLDALLHSNLETPEETAKYAVWVLPQTLFKL